MTLRDRQAQQAKELILGAALGLFLELGYVATTMDDIAEKAGVARRTVYNQFGSKAELLIALILSQVQNARDDVGERQARLEELGQLDDPQQIIEHIVQAQASSIRHALPVVIVAYEASVIDGEVAKLLEVNEEHRYETQQHVLELLRDKGLLRTDVPFDYMMRGFWLLVSPRLAITALQPPWDIETYSQWLGETLTGLLLGCD